MSLVKVLLFGLLLYSVNVGLQISIGAYYLGMRECYRDASMSSKMVIMKYRVTRQVDGSCCNDF